MNTHTTIQTSLVEQIVKIKSAAQYAASVYERTRNFTTLRWADWHLHKALRDFYGEDIGDNFADACHDLGVDEDGEPLAGEAA